jgi:hypothetical protein
LPGFVLATGYWRGGGVYMSNGYLEIVLGRLENRHALPGLAAGFQADFEAFLQSVDADSATPGTLPYTDPSGVPILTLAG